jgi:ATP-dependent helicase/nuclease subunit B
MSVRFILGRSGTGKTSYCIKAIADELALNQSGSGPGEQPLVLLVPEQASYQAERSILADERIEGYHRLNVLSFDRLQFLLLGKNTAKPSLSNIGRQMVIHRILCDNIDKLKIFGSSAVSSGLSQQIAQTIAELHQYAKTPDDIDRLLGELKKDDHTQLTALKFADIGLILKEYINFVSGDFFDPDIQLAAACGAVGRADFIKGAKIWVDGFAGFTESELVMLAELLKTCDQADIALCLDPAGIDLANPNKKNLDPASLFYPTELTYCGLVEIIRKNNLTIAEPILLKKAVRFSGSAELAHVEKHIFTGNAPQLSSTGNIGLYSAANERAEARLAARGILDLIKNCGYRYRDIAVIASNIGMYQDYLTAYFTEYGIPFFIDRRKPLSRHPLARLITAALQIASGSFTNSNIFTYLKTGLVPVERFEIDELENYCVAFGISPGDWQSDQPWRFAGGDEDFDQERINLIRQKVVGPLFELRQMFSVSETITAEQFTRVVFDFLENLKVRETLGGWIEKARMENVSAAVEEHQQFYNKLVDIFDELADVFAGRPGRTEDFCMIINSAFSQLTMAFIPPGLDQVLIGSIERSRHPDLKAVFLIGATEKQFPAPVVPDSIFSDDDRRAAESADFALAPPTEGILRSSQYLAYIAFTRPSQRLYITYPSVDDKGSAVSASHLINELKSLFSNLSETSIVDQRIDIDTIQTETELTDLLCERLGRDNLPVCDNTELSGLLEDICRDNNLSRLGKAVLSAINYENPAKLDDSVIKECFVKNLVCSATRLSSFAACPYQHFAKYVLELKERKEFKFEPLDLGNFYHRILDALLSRLKSDGQNFDSIEDSKLLQLLKEQIDALVGSDSFLSNFASRREYNKFVIDSAGETLENFVLAIAQMVRAGTFKPSFSEVSFGLQRHRRAGDEHYETAGNYEIDLSSGHRMSLVGRIDRLDIAQSDSRRIAVVFDYKRSSRSFDWTKFYYGLDMQLSIYMLAVRNTSALGIQDAVGAFYLPVETLSPKVSLAAPTGSETKFPYKAKGLFNGDYFRMLDSSDSNRYYNYYVTQKDGQYGRDNISGALRPADFEKVMTYAKSKIKKLAEGILSGAIEVNPYRIAKQAACDFCKFKPVCRFDWQINSYNFLEQLKKAQVLERAEGIDG